MKINIIKISLLFLFQLLFIHNSNAQNNVGYPASGADEALPNIGSGTGSDNSAFGAYSMYTLENGSNNTGVGYETLYSSASTASNNSALGYKALYTNSSGNKNTGIGANALYTNSSGGNNTAVGYNAIYTNSTGAGNVGIGFSALYLNTVGENTAVGDSAMYNNGAGTPNVAVGSGALLANTTGSGNVAIGRECLYSNTGASSDQTAVGYEAAYAYSSTAGPNDAFGYQACFNNVSGYYNVGIGYQAMFSNTAADYNVAVGALAAYNLSGSGGMHITAVGYKALYANTAYDNTALGYEALENNTNGIDNTGVGNLAGNALTTTGGNVPEYNTAVGSNALVSETSGSYNTAIGYQSLKAQTGGNQYNTAIGYNSGAGYAAYSNCTFLGANSDASNASPTDETAVGYNAVATTTYSVYLGDGNVTGVYGPTYHTISDGRFKFNVVEGVKGLEFIEKLRPVIYNLDTRKLDEYRTKNMPEKEKRSRLSSDYAISTSIRQSGFIAQEVQQAAEEVGYDFNGVHTPQNDVDPYSLSYATFVVPLVKGMQEQQAMIDEQDSIMNAQQNQLNTALNTIEVLTSQLQAIQDCCDKNGGNGGGLPSNSVVPQLLNSVPNPTANASAIYYFVPQTSQSAKIEITDATGVILQTIALVNFGYSSTNIQTNTFASGTYFYSLIVDEKRIDTKKLSVVLK